MKILTKSAICVCFMCVSVFSQETTPLEQLVETEKSFAAMASNRSVRQAFLANFSDTGIVFQPAAVNAKEFWQARPDSPALLAWHPVWADIARDGQLGYTTGPWDLRPEGKDGDPTAFGQYFTIWNKQPDGKFKAVLDIGVVHAKPEQVLTEWSSPQIAPTDRDSPEKTASGKVAEPELTYVEHSLLENSIADDVRILRDQKFPLIGKQAALNQIQSERVNINSGRVVEAKTGGSSDFRYGYGILELTPSEGPVVKGNLVRIWKLRQNQWQITFEIFTPFPNRQ